MVEISSFTNVFLQNGSGYIFQTLLSDLLLLGIIVYIITAASLSVLVPVLKPAIAVRYVDKQIGGPKPHWFYGNIEKYGFTHEGILNIVATIKQFPAMCIIYRSIMGIVVTYHPDVSKKVLSPSYPKSLISEKFFKIVFREGLVSSSGELWKRHRRLLTPVFHYGILKGYFKIFNKNCQVFLKACEDFSRAGKPCDITESIACMTHTNMMECIMSQTDDNNSGTRFLHSAARELSVILMNRCANLFYWFDFIFFLTKGGRELKKVHDRFEAVVSKIINERRALIATMQRENDSENKHVFVDETTGKSHTFRKHKGRAMDFLDILIQTRDEDGKGLSDAEIYDEVATFFIGGQDTATTALSWILYHLSIHEDCQERCRNEINNVLGQRNEVHQSDLPNLVYVTQCIKESMRLFPPIHSISRAITEDLTVSHRFNDYKEITIKKGTTVAVNIFALHRNPYVWDNPEVYDPERFNSENIAKIPPFAYLPFSAGPRNCIGQNFAMPEMKIFLAHVLRRYKFIYPPNTPEPRMNVGIALTAENGLPLIVKRVEA